MTQNVYSDPPAGDRRDIERRDRHDSRDENQSPNEIRADIDQTRAAVGDKIDQLQARLDPQRLKEQATESMQEMISDTANSVTEYVRTHRTEMVSSVTDAARRNPIPTALAGLGLGWLLLESIGGSEHDDERRWEGERRYLRQPSQFEGTTEHNFVAQERGQYMEEEYYSPEYYDTTDYDRSGYPPPSQVEARYKLRRKSYGNGHRRGSNQLKKVAGKAAGTFKETATDAAGTMKDTAMDAARRNPIPTALIGLGLGWLLMESMGGGEHDDEDRWEGERRYLRQPSRFEGTTEHNFVAQERGQYMEEEYYSPEYYDTTDYDRSGYPPPSEVEGQYERRESYGNGHQRGSNPLKKAAGAIKDTAADAAGAVKDTASDIGNEIKDRVQDAGQEAKDRMDNMRNETRDRVRGTMDNTRRRADEMGYESQRRFEQGYDRAGNRMQEWRHEAGDQMQGWQHEAGHQMQEWRDRSRYESRRRGRQFVRNLEDNPLTYGAVALAAGAALALLLPRTRMENRAFGETRDQVMEQGQDAMRTARRHAQEVVDEVRPELEQKGREIAQDMKETGKQAAKDAANEMRPVLDKAKEKGKEEARSAAQESGVDPDKMSGKTSGSSDGDKMAINRDTLQGQWKQVKGEVKSRWGKLTDDDMTRAEGNYDKLVGSIQQRYGYSRERAEQEVNDFFKSKSQSKV